ncbi:MAG: S8 family serine peptidase [Candidatus Brocadiia bacterium]
MAAFERRQAPGRPGAGADVPLMAAVRSGRRLSATTLWVLCLLIALASLAGCLSAPRPSPSGPAVIFLLDSPVNHRFLEGRVAGLRASDVSHGSLVGRVMVSYCDARIVAIPVETAEGAADRTAYLEGLRTALEHARRHPADKVVVNISLAAPDPDDAEAELMDRLHRAGVLVVAAAGNDDSDERRYPAGYDEVVAVASATREGKALHSNFGPHIDIAASGDISFIDYEFLPYERLRREMEARGTSFAAPRVAATVAFVLNHRPELSPRDAFRLVADSAVPIPGPHYRDGLLGAGLLDVRRARGRVAPGYRFANYLLPVAVWVILGVVSIYLCVRRGAVGLFLTLMLWLVALPLSYLAVVESGRWLQYVGGGSLVVGLGIAAVMCAAATVATALQAWQPAKGVLAAVVPLLALAVLAGTRPGRAAGPVYLAIGGGLAAVTLAGAWEWLTRRRLRTLRDLETGFDAAAEKDVLATCRHTLDRRLRRAALEALGRAGGSEAVSYLLGERHCPKRVRGALARIAVRDMDAVRQGAGGLWQLPAEQRRRLLAALRDAGNPAAVPWLQQAAHRRQDDGLAEALAALREEEPRGES